MTSSDGDYSRHHNEFKNVEHALSDNGCRPMLHFENDKSALNQMRLISLISLIQSRRLLVNAHQVWTPTI